LVVGALTLTRLHTRTRKAVSIIGADAAERGQKQKISRRRIDIIVLFTITIFVSTCKWERVNEREASRE